jgi:hypothetical protein
MSVRHILSSRYGLGTVLVKGGRSLEAGGPYLDVMTGNKRREDGRSGGKLHVLEN